MPFVISPQDENLLRINSIPNSPGFFLTGTIYEFRKYRDKIEKINFYGGDSLMATGAAPALEPKAETTNINAEACNAQPATLKEHVVGLLRKIFEGREEYAGWHQ